MMTGKLLIFMVLPFQFFNKKKNYRPWPDLPAAGLDLFFGGHATDADALHRVTGALGYLGKLRGVVKIIDRLDDGLCHLIRGLGLENARADEHAVRTEPHHERSI